MNDTTRRGTMNRSQMGVSALVAAAVGGSAALVVTALLFPVNRTPIRRAQEDISSPSNFGAGQLCKGGLVQTATLALVPDVLVREGLRERVEYHAEIKANRGKNLGVAWEVNIIDDRGRLVAAKLSSGSARVKVGDTTVTGSIRANLADGFYSLQARAAVSADDEPSSILETDQYLLVSNGKWSELTDLEWRRMSRASLLFTENELARGTN